MMRKSTRNKDKKDVVKKSSQVPTTEPAIPKTLPARKRQRVSKTADSEDENIQEKTTKKKKTSNDKEASTMSYAPRTQVASLKKALYIGIHVSIAGGIQNSITNALQLGCNSFAIFLKPHRKWSSPPMPPQACEKFKSLCLEHKYDAQRHILPHGSYLVNLAQAEPEKSEKAYTSFLDDLCRCEALGIKLYNFHPGSSGKNPRSESIKIIAAHLNKAHKATSTVITVLENMAGSGNVIGSTWEDLRDIIELVDDKSRVGVCIDTCHAFAAGYDMRSPEAFKETMDSFSSIVGISYLKALHLNDSKAPFSSNRDVHANIGTGFLGLRAFHNVVNFEPFQDLPMILETPAKKKDSNGKDIEDNSIPAAEIKLLEGLVDVDPETTEFKAEEKRLQDLGAEDRKLFKVQNDKKQQKILTSMVKKSKKKKEAESPEASDSCCSH